MTTACQNWEKGFSLLFFLCLKYFVTFAQTVKICSNSKMFKISASRLNHKATLTSVQWLPGSFLVSFIHIQCFARFGKGVDITGLLTVYCANRPLRSVWVCVFQGPGCWPFVRNHIHQYWNLVCSISSGINTVSPLHAELGNVTLVQYQLHLSLWYLFSHQ